MPGSATGFWADVRAALAGADHDYTEGALPRSILLLAIPMVLEMCMESLFGVVNVFWVASLGTDATAAVGLTESVESLVYAVAMGVAMATTAMVARRIGEKNLEGAAQAAGQALMLGVVAALAIGIPGSIYAPKILELMGAESAVVQDGAGYTRAIQVGTPSIMMLFLINAIFRGAGDAAIAMRVLWTANLCNMALDPLLIFGWGPFPELGVTGAGVATTIGRSIGVFVQVVVLWSGRSRVRITTAHLRPDWHILRRLARISATGMLQYFITTASWVALVRIIAVTGSAAVAGYTIAIRIVLFSILPSWGLSNAAATLVGQNLGAQKPDRAEASVWRTGFYNMLFLGGVGALFLSIPEQIVALFTHEAVVSGYAVECLRVLSAGYLFYAYGMVMVQAFNGAGDTQTPTLINLACYWMFQIPLAWALALPLGWGASGSFWAVPAAECLLAAVGIWMFRRGQWKTREI